MEQVTRICPKCGAPRPQDAKECPACGVVFATVLASREANRPQPSATTPMTPRIRAVGRAQNVFRQGKLLVVQIGHSLPPRCVTCNSPAQTLLYKDSTYMPWTGWLFVVLVGLLSKGRVRRYGGFRAEFEVPLCARHESKRKLSNVILGSLLALFFLALLGGNFLGDKYPNLDPRLTVAPAGVVILAMLLGLVFSYRPFGLKKIDNQFIWLSRVSPEYLRELREEPTEDPETSVWKWLLICLAFAAVIAGGVWFQWRSAKEEERAAPKKAVASAAPAAPVAQAPPQEAKAPESDSCRPGFVWREARPEDHVCVTPETRQSVAEDNRQEESRRESGRPGTCQYGFVWREAYPGDVVCVTPSVRRMTRIDNAQAQERRGAP